MPDLSHFTPADWGSFIAGLLGAAGLGAAGGQRLTKPGALSEDDRKQLEDTRQRLERMEQSLAALSASIAAHREEDAGTRAKVAQLGGDLRELSQRSAPALEDWRREKERLGSIEAKSTALSDRLEEVERLVKALHDRHDTLRALLRELLPPGLTEAMSGLGSGVHALRHSIVDRFPRIDR